MAVFFVFIDGIGIGENRTDNPLAAAELKSFSWFTSQNGFHNECRERYETSVLYKGIDANLGIEGLPQSGTGQASLFSGRNASEVLGRHFGPFPHSETKPLLQEGSLFHQVISMGLKPCFLNAYPEIFFKKAEKKNRWSCTTLMVRSAGVRLNRPENVKKGEAVTAEIVQTVWRDVLKQDIPEIKPEEAAGRALKAMGKNDLVLFEYYLTDKAGHRMDRDYADRVLRVLDEFLFFTIKEMNEQDTLVITSDHGNLEDLSTKSHTRNPVPLFVKGDTEAFQKAESILDITPGILKVLSKAL
ncbi:MAG: hypothetical protein WD604_08695 [Balneolaceae bacterium]